MTVTYLAPVERESPARNGLIWHGVGDLPASLDARYRESIASAIAHMRTRMDQIPIAFRLLPSTFTLTELQEVYELLLGRRLHKASFRRVLQGASLVQATDAWRGEGRGRPAQLFRYAPRKRRGIRRMVRFEMLGNAGAAT
jgi:8-oxo-dGTP diphosphatase